MIMFLHLTCVMPVPGKTFQTKLHFELNKTVRRIFSKSTKIMLITLTQTKTRIKHLTLAMLLMVIPHLMYVYVSVRLSVCLSVCAVC